MAWPGNRQHQWPVAAITATVAARGVFYPATAIHFRKGPRKMFMSPFLIFKCFSLSFSPSLFSIRVDER